MCNGSGTCTSTCINLRLDRVCLPSKLFEPYHARADSIVRSRTDDLRHWSKFQGFCTFRRQAQRGQGRWSTGKCVHGPGSQKWAMSLLNRLYTGGKDMSFTMQGTRQPCQCLVIARGS